MNERMIELYKEACEFAHGVCKEEGRSGGPSDHIWNTLSTGRFAELIVRECADIADGLLEDNTGSEVMFRIKEHFGVE
jgi:hypothetical protein